MESNVYDNILEAQLKQKASFSNRHPKLDNLFKKNYGVLLKKSKSKRSKRRLGY